MKKPAFNTYDKYKEFQVKRYAGMKVEEVINGITIKANGRRKRRVLTKGISPTRWTRGELEMLQKVLTLQSEPNTSGTFFDGLIGDYERKQVHDFDDRGKIQGSSSAQERKAGTLQNAGRKGG